MGFAFFSPANGYYCLVIMFGGLFIYVSLGHNIFYIKSTALHRINMVSDFHI